MRVGERIRFPDGTTAFIDYSVRRRKISSWPATRSDLDRAGFRLELGMLRRPCKRCGTTIEFWRTPNDQYIPLEPVKDDPNLFLCHFGTCPHANTFRRKEYEPRPTQRELFK